MKRISQFLLLLSFSIAYSQTNFNLEISAPLLKRDSILIAPPESAKSASHLHNIKIHSDKRARFMEASSAASIKIKSENTITGYIEYPQPFNFSYFGIRTDFPEIFFIEKGNHKIKIDSENLNYTLLSKSLTNTEYKNLKSILKAADARLKPFQENSSEDIIYKQKLLQNYIRKNPGSYVAFWEIINDFSKYGFNKIYLETLSLLSNKVKSIYSYKELHKILQLENSTNVGGNFPDVQLNSADKIVKASFADYKLTLIDYWATTCKPCIQDLPKLIELYTAYTSKGVQFISVANDVTKERKQLANKILSENKVSWANYFDINQEFPKKLNAAGYPLQILVDQNGKIISRKLGELDEIATEIEKYVQ